MTDGQNAAAISASIPVEELLERYPVATRLLLMHGIPCLVCGEPAWGTLGEVLGNHGKSPVEAAMIIEELRKHLEAAG